MRLRVLWAVALATLRGAPGAALVDAAAAAVGAAALVIFVALGLGVGDAARRMFPADDRLVEVVPGPVSLGGLLGGGKLDEAALDRLARLPGVQAVWPRQNLQVPVAAPEPPRGLESAWAPGMTLQLPVVGVDPGLVAADTRHGVAFADPAGDGPIPVVLSRRLLEIYDKTIAPTWGVPGLPPGFDPVGLELPVRIGLSIVPSRSEARVLEARVKLAGLSDRVPLYAMAVPLDTVQRLHLLYRRSDPGYGQVTLLAARPDDAPAIALAARRMGFGVDSAERSVAERVGTVVAVTTGALAALALLMSGLAALAIARSRAASVAARARDIALLQALGATPGDVRGVVLLEAALLGGAGGVAGAALGRLLGLLGDLAWRRLLPDFPYRPETFFQFPPWLLAAAVAVAALAAVLGALAPAAAAARVDPARTLS
ncbi:MAG: FtsX-like permease family protein [Anaeromyxobacter sp.]|nr:FtsX-like permease family protein [Anaeromyxobacter sp.]MBL0275626.1 FtsX-like permease family protein [Anaeromyxobacter sp.]